MKTILAAILAFSTIPAFADGSGALFGGTSPDNNATTFTASTVTITGTGSACFTAGGLKVDCNLNQEYLGTGSNISTFTSAGALNMASGANLTLSGSGIVSGGGVSSTYGVQAATASFGSGATISTFSATGSLTLDPGAALTAQSASLPLVTSSMAVNGAAGISVKYGAALTTVTVTGNNVVDSNGLGEQVIIQDTRATSGPSSGILLQQPNQTNAADASYKLATQNAHGSFSIFKSSVNTSTRPTLEVLKLTAIGSTGAQLGIPLGGITVAGAASSFTTGSGNSPSATFTPNLSSNTASGALSGTFTNTTLGLCIAGSTQTLTLPSGVGTVMFTFHGTISVASLAAVIGVGVIVDGGYVDGETSSKGLVAPLEPVVSDGTNVGFTTIVTGLSAATHNYCLSAFVSTGTGTIDSTNSVAHLHAVMLP